MIVSALTFAFAALALALFCNLWRLLKGPSITDRILALDTMVINAIAVIVLYGVLVGRSILFEAAILMAMVGFVSSVAFCRFVLRGDVIE